MGEFLEGFKLRTRLADGTDLARRPKRQPRQDPPPSDPIVRDLSRTQKSHLSLPEVHLEQNYSTRKELVRPQLLSP